MSPELIHCCLVCAPTVTKHEQILEPIFVYIAARKPAAAINPSDIPPRTLVLYEEDLKRLYGPSLWARPQFFLRHDQQPADP